MSQKISEFIKIKSAFLLTNEGEAMIPLLEKYRQWEKGESDDTEVQKRREALLATGTVTKQLEGKLEDRIEKVFETQDGLSLQDITDAVNEILEQEGKGEQTTLAAVRSSVNFHCVDHLDRKTKKLEEGFLVKNDDGESVTYSKKDAPSPASKTTKPKKNRETANA